MALDFDEVLRRGYRRTVAPNGVRFLALFFLLSLVDGLLRADLGRDPDPSGGQIGAPKLSADFGAAADPGALSLGLPPLVASALLLVVSGVTLVVTLGALRTFVSDETGTVRREHFTRNLLWAAVNLVVGSFVFGFAVVVGLVAFVIPGLFLLVSLFFWEVFVAVEDENFVDAFASSWRVTSGHRLSLFLLGVVVAMAVFLVSVAFAILTLWLPDALVFLLESTADAVTTVFLLATIAATYVQLTAAADDADPDAQDGAPPADDEPAAT